MLTYLSIIKRYRLRFFLSAFITMNIIARLSQKLNIVYVLFLIVFRILILLDNLKKK